MFKRMIRSSLFMTGLICGLVLFVIQPVIAGGWAVVTLDELPLNVQAGEPVQVSFQVNQHGIHPLEMGKDEEVVIVLQQKGSQPIEIIAQATDTPGHYAAEITLPSEGIWSWEIRPSWFPPSVMPDLTVAPLAIQPAAQQLPTLTGWEWWQRVAFQVVAFVRQPDKEPVVKAKIDETATDPVTDGVAYGKALFLAKGCVTCHVNGKVGTQFSVEAGPDLTHYKVIPEYVRVWLHDPASIKPATQMPNPHLSDSEIDALIAFLSEEK